MLTDNFHKVVIYFKYVHFEQKLLLNWLNMFENLRYKKEHPVHAYLDHREVAKIK